MNYDDGLVFGKVDTGIRTGDRLVIPVRDLPQENSRQRLWSELDFSANAGDVIGWNHRTQHRRHVQDLALGLCQLLVAHGAIAGAKVNRPGENLANTAAAADRLVVELNVGMR